MSDHQDVQQDAHQDGNARPPLVEPDEQDQGQPELDLGVMPTGSTAIDAALQPLEQLSQLPVGEHADVYQGVLDHLTAAMAPDTAQERDTDHDA